LGRSCSYSIFRFARPPTSARRAKATSRLPVKPSNLTPRVDTGETSRHESPAVDSYFV
jgi:hypothetical protein